MRQFQLPSFHKGPFVLFTIAVSCSLALALTAFAAGHGRSYVLRQGDQVSVGGLDLRCSYLGEAGAQHFSCGRASTFAGIAVMVTRSQVQVWKRTTITGRAKLLYAHPRNP
jgi:hypothetical protein